MMIGRSMPLDFSAYQTQAKPPDSGHFASGVGTGYGSGDTDVIGPPSVRLPISCSLPCSALKATPQFLTRRSSPAERGRFGRADGKRDVSASVLSRFVAA